MSETRKQMGENIPKDTFVKTRTINDRIRYVIEKERCTISSFARRTSLGNQTIRNITLDRNKPSYEVIVKIIESFDWIDANWLVMGEENVPEINYDRDKLYSIISSQQKIIEKQQDTIDKLMEKFTQDTITAPSSQIENAV